MRRAPTHEDGFTLIELLVVVLVVGILAAIALPAFLGQRQKAEDAGAKANARNMVTQLESCYAGTVDYSDASCLPPGHTSLPVGSGPGEVEVTSPDPTHYVITAHSRSGTDFVIVTNADGDRQRTCSRPGIGACERGSGGGVW